MTSPASAAARSGEQIDEGGLAGAVRADDGNQFSFGQIEVDIVDGVQPTETLRELYSPKYGFRHRDELHCVA